MGNVMDLSKCYDFLQPEKVSERIHIVGCGSVGSTLAENLCRNGFKNFDLWDFDTVESHNISNQMFIQDQVGMSKVEALKDILVSINPECRDTVVLHPEGWHGDLMTGYVFLAVDSIEIRKEIVERHKTYAGIKAMFDVRTLLTGAQSYGCDWTKFKQKKKFLETMNFSHEEAAAETPVSACGITLGIATTVRLVSAITVNNFIKFVKGEGLWNFCQFDGFSGFYDHFVWS